MKKYLTHVIIPIFFGGVIYLFFRDENLLMFKWIDCIGISNQLNFIKNNVTFTEKLPVFLLNSLPDALWVYSFVSFCLLVWKNNKTVKTILVFIVIIISIAGEIGQCFFIIPGTFDIIDLCLIFVGFLIPVTILYISKGGYYA